jgi:alcohol dehydrogenase class IV
VTVEGARPAHLGGGVSPPRSGASDGAGPSFVYQALPQRIIFGAGRLAEVADAVRAIGGSRALVLSTPEQREAGLRVVELLGKLKAGFFAGAVMHTPVEVTELAAAIFEEHEADCIVAIGGGSTTGLGKAIALRNDAPQLAVPTTYAGSEVTPILGETAAGEKKTIRSPKVLPEAVIYDVELTLSLSARLSATSGMNAMAHAAEALYAPDGNPIVAMMAEEGLQALAGSLPRIVAAPADRPAREAAQYGAWLCGMCLGSTSMALHHKLCHVLGGTFGLPHAETHAIVLPHAIAYNAARAPEAMARIARAIGAEDAAEGLYGLARSLDIPVALKDIGMPREGIDRAAALALANQYWNPRPLEGAALRDLIERAWAGEPPRNER